MSDLIHDVVAQIHHWPWAVEMNEYSTNVLGKITTIPFYGSPVISLPDKTELLLPRRFERFAPLGAPYEFNDIYRVYETPHGIISGTNEKVKIKLRSKGKRSNLVLSTTGAVDKCDSEDTEDTSIMYQHVLTWSQFFDDLFEQTQKKEVSTNSIEWRDVLGMLEKLAEPSEPRMALIIRIAEKMQRQLPEIVSGMRKILIRHREQVPVQKVSEMDSNCLKWYIKQPGTSIAEKGGNKQRLLAVVRNENYDTLENRVLKDFIRLCRKKSNRYLINEIGSKELMKKSKRCNDVKKFKTICNMCFSEPVFNTINLPIAGFRPNYVLQNDSRYKEVWKWYKKLLKQDEEVDQVWDWQTRTWADIMRLFVGCALKLGLNNPFDPKPLIEEPLMLTPEQRLGCRIVPGSEPGPFRLFGNKKNQNRILEIVHPEQAEKNLITKELGRTGGHLYLLVRPIDNKELVDDVYIFWSVNTAGVEEKYSLDNIASSAYKSLQEHKNQLSRRKTGFPRLFGVVVISMIEGHEAKYHKGGYGKTPIIEAPADVRGWGSAVETLSLGLSDIFKESV